MLFEGLLYISDKTGKKAASVLPDAVEEVSKRLRSV